nr:hypothetical protein [uncultured Schaedlerella sp.]
MDRQRLARINPAPFPKEWDEWEAWLTDNGRQTFHVLMLGFAYFKKLTAGDIEIPFPDISFSQMQNSRMENWYEIMQMAGEALLFSITDWSSFSLEIIGLAGIEELTETEWEFWLQMDDSSRKEILMDHQSRLFFGKQLELFRQMPEPVLNSMDFQFGREIVYLTSKKLADYLWFTDENPQIIGNQFSQENRQIQNALSALRFPVWKDWGKAWILKREEYIIGFCFGADLDDEISYKDLSWNFFTALYVLEKLLDLADEIFDFTAEALQRRGEEDGF